MTVTGKERVLLTLLFFLGILFLLRSATVIINTPVTFPLGNVSQAHGQLLGLLLAGLNPMRHLGSRLILIKQVVPL